MFKGQKQPVFRSFCNHINGLLRSDPQLQNQASMVESSYGVGKLEGREEERMHVAINLLDILDDATIAVKQVFLWKK